MHKPLETLLYLLALESETTPRQHTRGVVHRPEVVFNGTILPEILAHVGTITDRVEEEDPMAVTVEVVVVRRLLPNSTETQTLQLHLLRDLADPWAPTLHLLRSEVVQTQ